MECVRSLGALFRTQVVCDVTTLAAQDITGPIVITGIRWRCDRTLA